MNKEEYGYYINSMQGELLFVIAKNIAEACDKLEASGYTDYLFVHSKSIKILE